MITELIENARRELLQEIKGDENSKMIETYYVEGMRKAFMLMFEQSLYGCSKIDLVE